MARLENPDNRERLVLLLNQITYRYAPERGVTAEYIATILNAMGVVAPKVGPDGYRIPVPIGTIDNP